MKRVYRMIILSFIDIALVLFWGAVSLVAINRFRDTIYLNEIKLAQITVAIVFSYYLSFLFFKLYKRMWRYATVKDYLLIWASCFFAGVLIFLVDLISASRIFNLFSILLYVLLVSNSLIFVRLCYYFLHTFKRRIKKRILSTENVLIVGAGEAGRLVINEINEGRTGYSIKCLVDDAVSKQGRIAYGYRIAGTSEDIPELCRKKQIKTILFAIPSCSEDDRKRILNICYSTKCKVKVIPYLYDVISGAGLLKQYKDLDIEDLLGRPPVQVLNEKNRDFIRGKVCMVTGGGGSIGSELCRQIMQCSPKLLIIVDNYENNAYSIQQELISKHGCSVNMVVEIASVQDYEKMEYLFKIFKPELVFHAAAHKHVPLMEENPEEAVKNNIFGTYNIAEISAKHNVQKFVLVSTDKAVNPTNFMGATKRVCEMIVQYFTQRKTNTEFVAVRFGNVLGSNGSVIPLFLKQIKENRCVTVTDANMTRFFMTIPEAVSLIMKAGSIAKGGEIFVLDMDKPVKILKLAEDLITLAGFKPYVDVDIVFTGLRPGEKLYEEILMDEEGLVKTEDKKIFIGKQIDVENAEFAKSLKRLKFAAATNDYHLIKKEISAVVPTFKHNQVTSPKVLDYASDVDFDESIEFIKEKISVS